MASPASDPATTVSHPEEESPASAAATAEGEQPVVEDAAVGEGEEEEEEGECGFCLYMKGGGCRDALVAWEECVEAAREESSDMVERCFEATANLKRCMDAHADYYAPVLCAEQAVNDHADAAIAAADAQNSKEGEAAPSTDETKVHTVAQEAASAAEEKKQEVEDKSSSSSVAAIAAIDVRKEEEVVIEKVDS